VPLLRYHHAAALKEVKQMAEAAQILDVGRGRELEDVYR